jgi:putative tributyrin esterase
MALVNLNFESQYLMVNHEVSVILPDKPREQTPADFYGSGKKYPVLWLLHGTFGDHSDWLRKSMIELYACENDLIVVMPSALNSNYMNWKGFGTGFFMEDYLIRELMPLIYNWFPASDKREDNFIAGLSMGGGGTMQYACAYPERFAGAAILSAGPMDYKALFACQPGEEGDPFMTRFRGRVQTQVDELGGLDAFLDSACNPWDKLPGLIEKGTLPRLYFAIGREDFGYQNYLKFKDYADKIGLEATFEEFDGYEHEWRFWDLTIQRALKFFGFDSRDAGNPF